LIFHLASAVGVELIVADPVHVVESTIFGTRAVLAAANRYRKPVCITSSSEVYGKSERVPFAEDDDLLLGATTKGRWSYATSKVAIEHLSLAYHRQMDLPVIVVRLFNTVGPRQRGRYGMVIPRLVSQALAGEALSVYGDGTQRRCFCDVADVVEALMALVEHPDAIGSVFNIGSTHEVSIAELAETILERVAEYRGIPVAEHPSRVTLVPYEDAYGPGFEDMSRRLPSIARIANLIGWQPHIPLDETLRKVIADRSRMAPTRGRAG
jgi:UDP-glucose 4-epimerase